MSYTTAIRRGMSALVALVLMVGLAIGQNNFAIQGGAITNTGTIKVKGNITNTATATIGGTVQLKANAVQTIGTGGNGDLNFARLVIPSGAGDDKTFNVSSTISDTIGIWSSAVNTSTFVLGANTLTLQGVINNTGAATAPYSFATGTVDYDGPDDQSVFGGSGFTYGTLIVSNDGDKSMSGNITVSTAVSVSAGNLSIGANTLTVNGSYTVSDSITGGATSDLVLGGTGNIGSFVVYGGLSDLTIDRNTNTITLGQNLTVNDGLTLNNGTLAVSVDTLTLNGTVTAAGSGALTSAVTGLVNYAQSSNGQSVLAANYGGLTFSSFNKTLPPSTVGIAGIFTPGGATGHTVTDNTISFNGTTQNIPSFNDVTGYNILKTEGDLSVKTATGNIIADSLNNGNSGADSVTITFGTNTLAASTIINGGALLQFGGVGNYVATGSVEYNGTIPQTIVAGPDYFNLLISGNSTKNILTGETVGTHNTLIVATTSTLDLNDATSTLNLKENASLTVIGTLVNAGTIDVGN